MGSNTQLNESEYYYYYNISQKIRALSNIIDDFIEEITDDTQQSDYIRGYAERMFLLSDIVDEKLNEIDNYFMKKIEKSKGYHAGNQIIP